MADFGNMTGALQKLNNYNYDYWKMCIEAYFQGQDMWEIVGGSETTQFEDAQALSKQKIKAGKALYVLRTTVQKALLEYIREATTPKEV